MTNENTGYTNLLISFPPRPIKSEEDFEKTQVIVDKLLDKGNLTEEEEDYLFVLGMLIHEYEEHLDLVPDIYGVELLKVLIEETNLKQKDLVSIFKTESIVSDVLQGKRKLTVEHIQKLGEFFKVSPAVFFPINPSVKDFLEVA
jgi:HTH-type transcriptional regulator / antitoxin HigA